jgi:hypothetical protein
MSVMETRTSCTTAVRLVSGTVGLFVHIVLLQPDSSTMSPVVITDRMVVLPAK